MALYTALAYRDRPAAIHSHRVADLCVIVGRKSLDPRTQYWLETCALLRLVGRLGQGPTTVAIDESTTSSLTSSNDTCLNVTKEILRTTFGSEELIWIVSGQSCPEIEGTSDSIGERLDLCALILSCSVQLVDLAQANGTVGIDIVRRCLERIPNIVDTTLIQAVMSSLSRPFNATWVSPEGKTGSLDNKDARIVSVIGPCVDDLCTAIANRDVIQLKQVVVQLIRCATESSDKFVNEMVGSFKAAVENRDPEFDQLSLLADQLLDLCRITRQSIIETIPDHAPVSMDDNSPDC
jgi:hypothetical protein